MQTHLVHDVELLFNHKDSLFCYNQGKISVHLLKKLAAQHSRSTEKNPTPYKGHN
jgi:hypothetical protein